MKKTIAAVHHSLLARHLADVKIWFLLELRLGLKSRFLIGPAKISLFLIGCLFKPIEMKLKSVQV